MNAELVAGLFQDRGPIEWDRGVLVDLEDGFFPGCLMGELPAQRFKTVVGDDFRRAKILELRRLRPVVGGDVGNEIGG
jgi:hypothetical protein